ncbi:MAG: hypothetical protein ABI183_26320 [Polyangiaceae bacterium]
MSKQVSLPEGESGSQLLHRVVSEAASTFAESLPGLKFPVDPKKFKNTYGDSLSRFEAARLGSPKRVEIARAICDATATACELDDGFERVPLREALKRRVPDREIAPETMHGNAAPDLRVEVPFEGKTLRGDDVLRLVDRFHGDHHMTDAARDGLHWIVKHTEDNGGNLDLRKHKFAVLGAAAELSPAPLLLRAGASVLWVDPRTPTAPNSGTLVYDSSARDLLSQPQEITQAIECFADGEKVHVGMFAYAPGQARELRLAETMNAIVEQLGQSTVASAAMFVSPTSPAAVQPEDAAVVASRGHAPAAWQRALAFSGIVKGPGFYGEGTHAVARAVISLQGAGYQAAQYLSKILRAEVWAEDGMHVSANVAGISRTKSLEHPLFLAAFEGAPSFGVRIFDADTTRSLATLLMLGDLLRPKTSADHVHSAQIHGGVYDLPWQFEASVKAAAVLGAMRKPSVFFRRRSA